MSKISSQVQKVFARWGRSGGQLRAKRLSSSQRSQIASQAARARWKSKAASASEGHLSIRLRSVNWKNPVYLEEILSDGKIADWRVLYRQIAEFPFGETADVLLRVLESTQIYGVTSLWKGLLRSVRGGIL